MENFSTRLPDNVAVALLLEHEALLFKVVYHA